MHRSDTFHRPFPKKFVISVVSVAKSKKHRRLCFYICVKSFALFYGDFCMDLYSVDSHSVDSDKAMQQSNEALNASSLQFLSNVKRLIATFYFSVLYASSTILF